MPGKENADRARTQSRGPRTANGTGAPPSQQQRSEATSPPTGHRSPDLRSLGSGALFCVVRSSTSRRILQGNDCHRARRRLEAFREDADQRLEVLAGKVLDQRIGHGLGGTQRDHPGTGRLRGLNPVNGLRLAAVASATACQPQLRRCRLARAAPVPGATRWLPHQVEAASRSPVLTGMGRWRHLGARRSRARTPSMRRASQPVRGSSWFREWVHTP